MSTRGVGASKALVNEVHVSVARIRNQLQPIAEANEMHVKVMSDTHHEAALDAQGAIESIKRELDRLIAHVGE